MLNLITATAMQCIAVAGGISCHDKPVQPTPRPIAAQPIQGHAAMVRVCKGNGEYCIDTVRGIYATNAECGKVALDIITNESWHAVWCGIVAQPINR